ncbi:MAG: GNAT family N-acetyltransferase [Clostridia bacterium]|nr:GNAT family N-acetyltransferase [Clostridia bacterium]
MLKICNIKDHPEFIEEIAILTRKEWGQKNLSEKEFQNQVEKAVSRITSNLDNPYYCKLILIDDDKLIGFISLFENDCDEKPALKPWYATMYVKSVYRGNGYSRMLNEAIIAEAKKRGFKKLYLKSDLVNYYEKFGFVYLENLSNGEKLYYMDL